MNRQTRGSVEFCRSNRYRLNHVDRFLSIFIDRIDTGFSIWIDVDLFTSINHAVIFRSRMHTLHFRMDHQPSVKGKFADIDFSRKILPTSWNIRGRETPKLLSERESWWQRCLWKQFSRRMLAPNKCVFRHRRDKLEAKEGNFQYTKLDTSMTAGRQSWIYIGAPEWRQEDGTQDW